MSCCLVRLSSGGLGLPDEIVPLPACTQRRIRRGAALASRLDPPALSGDKRGRSKALFYAVVNGTSISDPEPVNFSCDPENWAYGQATSESTAIDIISARISFSTRAAIVPLLGWLPARVAHDFCNPDNSGALAFAECHVANWPWIPDLLHKRSRLQRTKVVTGPLETDAR